MEAQQARAIFFVNRRLFYCTARLLFSKRNKRCAYKAVAYLPQPLLYSFLFESETVTDRSHICLLSSKSRRGLSKIRLPPPSWGDARCTRPPEEGVHPQKEVFVPCARSAPRTPIPPPTLLFAIRARSRLTTFDCYDRIKIFHKYMTQRFKMQNLKSSHIYIYERILYQ